MGKAGVSLTSDRGVGRVALLEGGAVGKAGVFLTSDRRSAVGSAPPCPVVGGVGSEKRVGSVIGGSPRERIAVGFGSAGPTSRLGKPDPYQSKGQ